MSLEEYGTVPYSPSLLAVAILERDDNGDILWSWVYPYMDEKLKRLIVRRGDVRPGNIPVEGTATWSKYGDIWHYTHTAAGVEVKDMPRVQDVSVAVLAKNFNPEQYIALAEHLSKIFVSSGSPPDVLEGYLAAYTEGVHKVDGVSEFDSSEFTDTDAWMAASFKDMVNTFGIEIMNVWTAVLIRRRVVVYAENKEEALKIVRTLPLFCIHRREWDMLRPYVTLSKVEMEDLANAGVYIAGFTDASVVNREELYDVVVDATERTVTLPAHSKADFAVGNLVKDIALSLMESCENEESTDADILKKLSEDTVKLVNNVKGMAVDVTETDEDGNTVTTKKVTRESLQARNLAAPIERFLYNIATAEGMT